MDLITITAINEPYPPK